MKKLIAIILTLAMAVCAFCACAGGNDEKNSVADSSASESVSESTETSDETSEETSEESSEASSESASESASESEETSEQSAESSESADTSYPQNGGDDALAGTWYADGVTMKLEADGTGIVEMMNMSFDAYWGIVDGKLYLTISAFGAVETTVFDSYEATEESLTLVSEAGTAVYSSTPVEAEEVSVPEEIDEALVGTWKGTAEDNGETVEITYTFNADGSGSATMMGTTFDSRWGVADGKLVLSINAMGTVTTEATDYTLEGDTLTVTDELGNAVTLTKA